VSTQSDASLGSRDATQSLVRTGFDFPNDHAPNAVIAVSTADRFLPGDGMHFRNLIDGAKSGPALYLDERRAF
jgi:hypothetical protein